LRVNDTNLRHFHATLASFSRNTCLIYTQHLSHFHTTFVMFSRKLGSFSPNHRFIFTQIKLRLRIRSNYSNFGLKPIYNIQ
jgi:hypothetical protein